MQAAGGTLLRLVGLGRVVLPRLVVGHSVALRRASAVSEAPLRRCLRLVVRDETEQWRAVEALIETLLRRPHDVAVVTAHQQQLEQLVAGAGRRAGALADASRSGLSPWSRASTLLPRLRRRPSSSTTRTCLAPACTPIGLRSSPVPKEKAAPAPGRRRRPQQEGRAS